MGTFWREGGCRGAADAPGGAGRRPPRHCAVRASGPCPQGFPWINNLIGFYEAKDLVGFDDFAHVVRALKAFLARPAVERGLTIPSRTA
jgi:hypothetical protein